MIKEKFKHKLLAFLHSKKASELNPFKCHISLDSINTLQIPTVTEIFEDNKGIIWLKVDDTLIEFNSLYTNADLLLIEEGIYE